MLSCSIWFSAPSFWMGGGLESRCVGRVYGADGAVRLHDRMSRNSSPSSVAPLYKKDKHLSSCIPPSIPILRYLSPINNSNLSYIILYTFPSSLESPLGSFLV